MFKQQDFQFVSEESAAPEPPRSRLGEYARLFAMLIKFYLQARLLMAQNVLLSWRLQLGELPLIYLKTQVFLVRLSLGLPLAQCWPAENSSSAKRS